MNKNINNYRAVAALVRGFFEAFARGIIDANCDHDDFKIKNNPTCIKEMMKDHYEEISHNFLESVFLAVCRLNYKDFDEVEKAMPTESTSFGSDFEQYLRVACKTPTLFDALKAEYRRNFEYLLIGKFTSLEEHVRDYTHGVLISKYADFPMAIHLLVRVIVKAYTAGLKCEAARKRISLPPSLQLASVHAILITNVNILINETPLKGDLKDPDALALVTEACGGKEEYRNVLFNSLDEILKELAEE